MLTAHSPRVRFASPERWEAALGRALANGLCIYQEAGTGMWLVTSASKPGTVYATDGASCSCEAALLGGDPVCQHRALFWHQAGVLDLPAPAPEPVPFPGVNYIPCSLTRIVPVDADQTVTLTAERCPRCRGAGTLPVPDGEVACTWCGDGWVSAAEPVALAAD